MNREPKTIAFWRGRLPHWEVVDGVYFVTVHVAGAIPPEAVKKIRDKSWQLGQLPEEQQDALRREIFADMEEWLDRVEANAYFRDERIARLVEGAIEHRHERGDWQMIEYVIMPNHIHLLFRTERSLKSLMVGFKRWTATRAHRQFGVYNLWQVEWFDHWSRSADQDARKTTTGQESNSTIASRDSVLPTR